MKRITVSLSAIFVLSALLTLTSCQKEENGNGTQFRATMEDCTDQHAKTALDGTALNWVAGDQITVYGNTGPSSSITNLVPNYSGTYSATPQTPATTAIFNNVSGDPGDGPFFAFYPATIGYAYTVLGMNIKAVELTASQTYVESSIHEFPMYAESSDNQLAFKNLCGVLKLHLTKENVSISSIGITANTAINGRFTINYNNGDPQLVTNGNNTNTTILNCATAQSITGGKDFYIYLPEGSYSGLQIEMTTDDNRHCIKTANRAVNVTRSQYTLITLGTNNLNFVSPLPQGALPGLFSVSATQQVHFSMGNLQYQASTQTWRFAEHQYDFIGSDNMNMSATYSGWIDLFGWGTGNNPLLMSTDTSDYSTFVDWGTNVISNGGNQANVWRTFSWQEFRYLFNTRSDANLKYGTGSVNGVHGLIILPDDWTLPEGCSFTSGLASSSNNWLRNSYTLAQWAYMEAAGAVFLPAAGNRYYSNYNEYYGSWEYSNFISGGELGMYWIAYAWGGWADVLEFQSNNLYTSRAFPLLDGLSVRLVCND